MTQLKAQDMGRNDLIDKIEDLERRHKDAYLRLYEKVGQEIDGKMHKTLGMREKEILDEQERAREMTSDELVVKGLRQQADDARQLRKENVTINDLFRKYNV